MAKTQEKKVAKVLYTETGLKKEEVAVQLGIQARTLATWIEEGNWDAVKVANISTPKQVITRLHECINDILNVAKSELRPLDNQEIDGITKLTRAIQAQNRSYDFTMYVTVATELLQYAKGETDKAFLETLHRVQSDFLEATAKRLGA